MYTRTLRAMRALSLAAAVAAGALAPGLATQAQTVSPNAGIEARVREVFADVPDMVAVAKCESGYRQFGPTGAVLYGGAGGGYVGIFQIGDKLHRATAQGLGHDISTIEGNIGYARHLYQQRGTSPWRECVPAGSTVTFAPVVAAVTAPTTVPLLIPTPTIQPVAAFSAPAVVLSTASGALTRNLQLGMRHAEVRELQRLLNVQGFVVAASGAGSPGQETTTFGAMTREALRKFQCARQIVCEGSEASTGYGFVGPRTRAALMASSAR